MDWQKLESDTVKAFSKPKVGMRFHEMFSYWVYIIGVTKTGRIKIRTFSGHPANPCAETIKYRTFKTPGEFRAAFTYEGKPSEYTVTYCDNKALQRMKTEVIVTQADLDRGYIE